MKHFIIENLKNVDWTKKDGSPSSVRATLSVTVLDEMQKPIVTVHDCKLIDAPKGFFVSAPSRKVDEYINKAGEKKEYMDLAFIHFDHRDELNALAGEMYDPIATPTPTTQTDAETLAGMPV